VKDTVEKKSRKAEQFIAALLAHPSIEAAAKSIGIANATAWRWMQEPSFSSSTVKRRREAMRHTMARLQEAAREAGVLTRSAANRGE